VKLSVNWLRYLNDKYHCAAEPMPNGIDDLVKKIGEQLGAVEEVINLGERYRGIVVVKVVSAEKHPNADKLKVCLVDDGRVVKDMPRDDKGYVEVVCGAPNVETGQLVAWIPPGSTVPSSFDKDPFVIEKREIRGVVSNGMLASPKELALGDSHEGLLIIDDPAEPGQSFAELYRLDDYIIDIENKMFTHRPDLFGQIGLAREVAGIQQQAFKSPDWYREDIQPQTDGRNGNLKLEVKNDLPELVPRFCAQAIKDVKVKASPGFVLARLSSVGLRPINNVVDVTNYGMMEAAQPLHAYDYDKLKTGILGVRWSKKGEKLALLNGKELMLDGGDIVITDGQKPIGLAGIMGGSETEVDENTKNVVLECASFDMNQIRKTAMKYGLFTDASTRFTKNQSPRQNGAVITKAAKDVLAIAGGRLASPLVDDKHFDETEAVVMIDIDFINSRLGFSLSANEVKKLLENVEFKVSAQGQQIEVKVPFWRTDIEIAEDIVEEVGRLYGYDKLPQVLPKHSIEPVAKNNQLELKDQIRRSLSKYGANEVLTYTFVHGSLLQKVGQLADQAYQLKNALSPDLQFYRLSITPSLLNQIHSNIKRGFEQFGIFEFGKVHSRVDVDEGGLPKEHERLALVLATNSKVMNERQNGSSYFWAKKYLTNLLDGRGVEHKIRVIQATDWDGHQLTELMLKPFELKRSAGVFMDNKLVGVVGEYSSQVKKNLKLPNYCAGFELFLSAFSHDKPPAYNPLNKYPEIEQDVCLRTSVDIDYATLTDFIDKSLKTLSQPNGYNYQVDPLDIFQKDRDEDHKQTTWRIRLWHPEKTLTTEEVNHLIDKLAAMAKQELKAERI
jgi:phenylalanyl-tRNA synthetase beta chain